MLSTRMGGFYGTPHGLANAVILPHIMEEFGSSAEERLARLAEAVNITGADDHAKARAFIHEIRAMNERMGIPASFDFIRDEDVPTMIKYALAEANPVYPVPEIWNADRMREAIESLRSR